MILAKSLNCIGTVELHVSGTVAPGHPKMLQFFGMISDGTIKGVVVADLSGRGDKRAGNKVGY